jgi:dTDP-4-amino-4,6-dideoxygalactose transaminase
VARKDFLVFGAPKISEDEIAEVVAALRSGWIGTGPRAQEFERRFAEYVGAKHAVALNSCTAGLHLALKAAGIGSGDEVVTTPMTWCATANVIVHVGARPVFADVDRRTGNLLPDAARAAVTPRTRALLPVHFAGRACDMDALGALARERRLTVLCDAAHAIETTWLGRKSGTLGGISAYSFYANKNITTAEGGMAVTDDPALAERLRILSLHGVSADAWKRFRADGPAHVQVVEPGFKYNMADVQAALGLRQLDKIDAWHRRREELWAFYDRELAGLPLLTPPPPEPGCRHARHLYTVLVDDTRTKVTRDALREALKARKIGTGLHYVALHLQPYYVRAFGYRRGDFPNAEFISDQTLSLPLTPAMTDADAQDVARALKEALE